MNCERCGKAGACKVGGNPWLCDPCFWEHMNEGIAALMERLRTAQPPPGTPAPHDPARALREAARDVLAAYDFCRSKGSFSGFWTHIDDLAKALDAYPIGAAPETPAPRELLQVIESPTVPKGAAFIFSVIEDEDDDVRLDVVKVIGIGPASASAPAQSDPRIPDDREEET